MSNRALGRYDRISDSTHPGPDLPRAPRSMRGKIEIVEAAIPDPTNIGKEKLKRQRAAVNRLTDPLECERSFGRISEPAYLAGRAYMAVCERAATPVAVGLLEASSGAGDRDLAMVRSIDRIRDKVDMQEGVEAALGRWAAFILRGVLCDGHSFLEMAAIGGVRKRRKRFLVAKVFREGVEDLAKHWDRCGWPS